MSSSKIPHPLFSISLIVTSLSTFWYTFYSPYSLRKIQIDNDNNSILCITKQLNVFPQQHWKDNNNKNLSENQVFERDKFYIVEKVTSDEKTKKRVTKYQIQQCLAISGDFIESNRNFMRKQAAKSQDLESKERAFAWEWRSDFDQLYLDEHRLFLLSTDDFQSDFVETKMVSKQKRRAFERGLLIEKTIALISKGRILADKKSKDVDDEVFDSPLLIKECHLTWKSQIHEEPKWLLSFAALPKISWTEFDGEEFVRRRDGNDVLKEMKERITVRAC